MRFVLPYAGIALCLAVAAVWLMVGFSGTAAEARGGDSDSRLALLAQALVERCYGVREIQRHITRAVIFQELQLPHDVERHRSEVEPLVNPGRPARQGSTHESLRPVSPEQGIGFDVIIEPLARRSAQADNCRLRRLRAEIARCVDGHDGGEAQRRNEEQTSDVPTGHARADLRHNWAAVVEKPDWTSIQHLAVSHFLNFT